jgi:hypothetical protein
MIMAAKTFSAFWSEIGRSFLIAALKAKLYFLITLPVLVILLRWAQCNGWWGYTEPVKSQACVDMAYPFLYWTRILADFPRVFLPGFVIVLLAILYLEWDKYKKDKPQGFGVYGMRTAPNGGWLLSNFERIVSGKAWEKFAGVELHKVSDSENHLRGHFTDQEIINMVKAVTKRFTSFLRKPTIETNCCIEWHIHANSGEEVKLRLERRLGASQIWILIASRFDWVGRNQPPRLVETHHTEFVASSSKNQN